jgi:hypothetical protein
VLVLTTSNVTGAIDLAFVDRADIKQYIGPPNQAAIYSIYYSCIQELQRQGFSSSSFGNGVAYVFYLPVPLHCFFLWSNLSSYCSLYQLFYRTLLVEFPSEVSQSIGIFPLLLRLRKKIQNVIFVTKCEYV